MNKEIYEAISEIIYPLLSSMPFNRKHASKYLARAIAEAVPKKSSVKELYYSNIGLDRVKLTDKGNMIMLSDAIFATQKAIEDFYDTLLKNLREK